MYNVLYFVIEIGNTATFPREHYMRKLHASRNTDSLWLFPHVEADGSSHPYAHHTIAPMIAT